MKKTPFLEPLENRRLLTLLAVSLSGPTSIIEGNSGQTLAVYTVTINGNPIVPVSVDYRTADGTAKAGSDYVNTSGTLTFQPGGDSVQQFAVPITGDTAREANETFQVLLDPVNVGIDTGQVTTTIQNDDSPTVTIAATQPQAAEGGANGIFRVTRTGDTSAALKVSYTISGTATNAHDYKKLSGSITIKPGHTFGDITIRPIDDQLIEPSETVILKLKRTSSILLGPKSSQSATVTIADHDSKPPRVNIISAPALKNPAANYQFTLKYTDSKAMSLASIDDADILITGPNGFSASAHLVSKTLSSRNRVVTARYSIDPPADGWTSAANGTYSINIVASQVTDAAGNPLPAGVIGSFHVNIT